MPFLKARPINSGGGGGGSVPDKPGRIWVDGHVFRHEDGTIWSWHGATMFLLFRRWLQGQNIDPQISWMHKQGVNVARVLGMVAWPGSEFGPTVDWCKDSYWPELPKFMQYMEANKLRVEFTVFADAQYYPTIDQRAHLRRVLETIGNMNNVFIEICNEPWKNGVEPKKIFSASEPRPCPMASGDYQASPPDAPILQGLMLDYVTVHLPRTSGSWSRKAKDLKEYRDLVMRPDRTGSLNVPCVGDEPMGAAEADKVAGRQRSAEPDEHFQHHAVCAIFGAGSTFHCDAGLQAVVPPAGGAQQACADAVTLAWANIPSEFQIGRYTRSGSSNLPLIWEPNLFPEDTSRIYGMILGNRSICVAVQPLPPWQATAASGWRIAEAIGPQGSLVIVDR